MIAEQVRLHVGNFLDKDFGVESFAHWVGSRLSAPLDHKDFRGMDFESAANLARALAERHAETSVQAAIDENLPPEVGEEEWNWEALAKYANATWGTKLRDRDLKRIGRDTVDTFLIDTARQAISQADLSPAAEFLDPDYPLRTTIEWAKNKFGIHLTIDELRGLDAEDVQQKIIDRAVAAYEEKETAYPVLLAIQRFTTGGAHGFLDVEALLQWARWRLGIEEDLAELQNQSAEHIQQVLIRYSRRLQQRATEAVNKVRELTRAAFATDEHARRNTNGFKPIDELRRWLLEEIKQEWDPQWDRLDAVRLEQRLVNLVEDYFRPEVRHMERAVLLEIVDTAWKDHLLAMDHLLASIRLAGYAQMDPKVEYKREGMRMFQQMWRNIAERATELVFRMESFEQGFIPSVWSQGVASKEEAPAAGDLLAAGRRDGNGEVESLDTSVRVEPIRHRGERVGRNDPCPCGSGKKYKHCCMRKQGAVNA
jgi:preprotein translocase subunit SecA